MHCTPYWGERERAPQSVAIFHDITRQMIIAGGEPELCRRRHAKREGGVYANYVSVLSLVQNAVCCAYVG